MHNCFLQTSISNESCDKTVSKQRGAPSAIPETVTQAVVVWNGSNNPLALERVSGFGVIVTPAGRLNLTPFDG